MKINKHSVFSGVCFILTIPSIYFTATYFTDPLAILIWINICLMLISGIGVGIGNYYMQRCDEIEHELRFEIRREGE